MRDLLILFLPALIGALVVGVLTYAGTSDGSVFGRIFPALVTALASGVALFLASAAFLIGRWALARFVS